MIKIPDIENRQIVEKHERYVEIYKIICKENNKCYVGQAVSHILNAGKYKRHGSFIRFNGHVSEAFSTKKNQCHYLNNAIRKYGHDGFIVEILDKCFVGESDKLEAYYIKECNSMFPNGYNLKLGTTTTYLSEEGRKRVSNGVFEYYKDQKYKRFENMDIKPDEDITKYIKPLNRKGVQYGWYVYVNNTKADFGGIHISLDLSYERAKEFLNKLKEIYIAKHLDAGTSLKT